MQQVKDFMTRHRRWFIVLGYLAVLAAGVMFLRVTVNIPPEGDDKATLNGWMFQFEQTPFWQYALNELCTRLPRYLTLKEFRFFPFHYPWAVSLLFFGTMKSYRLYIIAISAAAAFLVSRVAARVGRSDALGLGMFALTLALEPLWNECMFSYYAVPQKTMMWAAAGWLCLFYLQQSGHKRWAVAAAVLTFVSCGTYEVGYTLVVVAVILWLLYAGTLRGALRGVWPVLCGGGVAFGFYFATLRANRGAAYVGSTVGSDFAQAPRVLVQQMASSIPFLNPMLRGEEYGTVTKGDLFWPLVLGLAAAVCLFFLAGRVQAAALGKLAVAGLALWAGPAAILALSQRYQEPGVIDWKWGYIPAGTSSVGMTLLLAALLALLAGACRRLPGWASVTARILLVLGVAAALCCNGAYIRAVLRTHHAENLAKYAFFRDSVTAGLADEVETGDWIVCNENVWAGSTGAESSFFSRFAGRELHAVCAGAEAPPEDRDGEIFGYTTYRNYGSYDLAWCGRAQDPEATLLNGMRVYVQSSAVPDNAVLKYKVQAADGSMEERAICLLDLDQTPRDARGDYFVSVYDENIVNAKVMIWPG